MTVTRPVNLNKGQDTARWVLDVITRHPENHDQMTWEEWGSGTTRCVGGWAVWAHGYSVEEDVCHHGIAHLAADLLDISDYDAGKLFYDTDNEQAVHALGFLTRGESIDWGKVYG